MNPPATYNYYIDGKPVAMLLSRRLYKLESGWFGILTLIEEED